MMSMGVNWAYTSFCYRRHFDNESVSNCAASPATAVSEVVALVTGRMRSAKFVNWDKTKTQEKAQQNNDRFVEVVDFDQGHNILYSGVTGI